MTISLNFKSISHCCNNTRQVVISGSSIPEVIIQYYTSMFCQIGLVWVMMLTPLLTIFQLSGPSWPYGSRIYNYLCNQCLSPLKLWVWTPLRRGILDTTLCDKVCQWPVADRWFSQGPPVFSTNKNGPV
jgi:hypothetical protein